MNIDEFVSNLEFDTVEELGYKDKAKDFAALRAVLKNIPTEKGKKYALSKFLNDYGYKLDDYKTIDKNIDEDYWSLKHQEDYTPPDVEKVIEKRNKEQAENFWNWDSDEHWTKKNVDELKRQAKDAGYDDFAGYLDKVREVQTSKDREKLYDENAMPGTKLLVPRMTEAVLRGEDPSKRDIGLDVTENAFYLFNPAGRFTRAGLQGVKAGKYLGGVANIADVLANPLMMETADAIAYGDEDNTDRKDFSKGDVLLGTGINAGMNKLMPYLFKNRDKLIAPVQKSKAQLMAEQEAKLASEEANKILENGGSREANETMKDLVQDELRRQDIREAFASAEDKRIALQELREQLSKNKVVEPRKTKYSERLLGDLDKLAALDYISNKTGDKLSEDPKMTKQLLTRSLRGFPLVPSLVSDFASDYYNRKEKNEEQNKINQAIKLLGGRK